MAGAAGENTHFVALSGLKKGSARMDVCKIIVKPMLNQENVADAVNGFKRRNEVRMFAPLLFNFKTTKMKKLVNWFFHPPVSGQSTILIIRLMAGTVFFWEGILKFVYVNQGVGRFTKLGFPFPETTAHVIATGEILGGLLLIFGLFTRITAFYFIVQMIVAVLSTKIDLYFGRSPLPMPPAPPKMGFWAVLHEIRSDYAQILTCLFLFIEGAGRRSLDFIISTKKKAYMIGENSEKSLLVFKENQPRVEQGAKKKREYTTVN